MADMPRIKSDVLRGNAEVRKAKKADGTIVFQIVLDQVAKDKTVTKIKFNVAQGKCPAYFKTGTWYVTVNADKDTVLSAVPDVANVRAEFHDISHAEGKPPFPKVNQSTFDPTKPWITWTLQWKVVGGEFDGMILYDFLNYNFGPFTLSDGKTKVAGYKPASGKATDALAQRIAALGVMDEPFDYIPWRGEEIPTTNLVNILPVIAARSRKMVEEHNRQVDIAIVGGKIMQTKAVVTDEEVDEWVENADETGDSLDDGAGLDSAVSETLPEDDEVQWAED